MSPSRKTNLFLQSLHEDGINEIYLAGKRTPQSTAPVSAKTPGKISASKEALLELRDKAKACTLCKELSETRHSVVFGSGNSKAKLMFVGEAPGADEDEQGLPFVGRAGQLLTKIIEAIGLSREQVFIANVLKCRPPANRQPAPQEIKNCSPYLARQIEIIAPKIICALGTFAAQTLLETQTPISQLRGQFYDKGSYKIICTYHPAYLLRNPADKRLVWDDMKKIKKDLDELA